ncbi:hypothetical protein CPB84DRAFT_1768285 [Gymnopilus junonius]|uniref:Uncharacterized protein n=1 Tax=Gymnopilus junonius TaxID=109634 RepID=A0A9P5NVF1_GYMJU|nr:hypothetical protein CPB84DRAFT_1768285 [Gymnopilus junonius]
MDWSKLRQTQYRRQYRVIMRTVGYQGPHAPNTLLDQSTFQPVRLPYQYSQPAGHPESSSATSHKAYAFHNVQDFNGPVDEPNINCPASSNYLSHSLGTPSCPVTPSIQLQTVEYPKASNTSLFLLGPHPESQYDELDIDHPSITDQWTDHPSISSSPYNGGIAFDDRPPMFSTDWETRPPLDYSNFSIAGAFDYSKRNKKFNVRAGSNPTSTSTLKDTGFPKCPLATQTNGCSGFSARETEQNHKSRSISSVQTDGGTDSEVNVLIERPLESATQTDGREQIVQQQQAHNTIQAHKYSSQGRHLPSASLAATSTTREQKHDKSADEPSSSSLPSASDNEESASISRLLDHLNEIEKMVILNIQHPLHPRGGQGNLEGSERGTRKQQNVKKYPYMSILHTTQ